MWSRILALSCAVVLLPVQTVAGVTEKIAALAPAGLVLVVDQEGNELVSQKADDAFVPASVTKIVIAWLAMEVLGGDYRFKTSFYLDGEQVLYIRGGGDPFLISEELAQLASALVAAIGKEPLSGIRARRKLLPFQHPYPRHRGHRRGLRRAKLRARGQLQHDPRCAQGQQDPLRRDADPDHAACYWPVPGAGSHGSRPHQPDSGARGGPAVRR